MTQLAKLPQNEIKALERFVQNTKRKDEYRRGAALLKLSSGKRRKEVADFFNVNVKTLDEWQRIFKKQSVNGLKTTPQKGNNKMLSKQDKLAIKKVINQSSPEELKLDKKAKFWTIDFLKKYVQREYGVVYKDDESYRRLFKFCGFTYHKPNKVNKKQNSHMQKRFEETLKKSSNGTEEKIVWYW